MYLKLNLWNNFQRFLKKNSEETDQVFSAVNLKTILYTGRPLSGIYKDVSPTQEKSNIIYKFSCHCGSDYMGKHLKGLFKNGSACSKSIEKLVWWLFWETNEKFFLAVGQHFLDNPECAKNYKNENFPVLVRAENSFQMHILEALCIQFLRPSLCKQKIFVY